MVCFFANKRLRNICWGLLPGPGRRDTCVGWCLETVVGSSCMILMFFPSGCSGLRFKEPPNSNMKPEVDKFPKAGLLHLERFLQTDFPPFYQHYGGTAFILESTMPTMHKMNIIIFIMLVSEGSPSPRTDVRERQEAHPLLTFRPGQLRDLPPAPPPLPLKSQLLRPPPRGAFPTLAFGRVLPGPPLPFCSFPGALDQDQRFSLLAPASVGAPERESRFRSHVNVRCSK